MGSDIVYIILVIGFGCLNFFSIEFSSKNSMPTSPCMVLCLEIILIVFCFFFALLFFMDVSLGCNQIQIKLEDKYKWIQFVLRVHSCIKNCHRVLKSLEQVSTAPCVMIFITSHELQRHIWVRSPLTLTYTITIQSIYDPSLCVVSTLILI